MQSEIVAILLKFTTTNAPESQDGNSFSIYELVVSENDPTTHLFHLLEVIFKFLVFFCLILALRASPWFLMLKELVQYAGSKPQVILSFHFLCDRSGITYDLRSFLLDTWELFTSRLEVFLYNKNSPFNTIHTLSHTLIVRGQPHFD